MKEKSNKGFLKGFGAGILGTAIVLTLFVGCNEIDKQNNSQIGTQTTENGSSGGLSGSSKPSEEKAYVPQSEVLTNDVIEKIDTLIQAIDYYYLYEYDKEEMQNALYKAVLSSLGDPYSAYYTAEEYEAFLEDAAGTYCGIGVVVSQNIQTGQVKVVRPYVNAPGYEAGMRPEDVILAVDGTDITGMDLNSAVSMIRGEEGTTVTITLYRDGETFDVVVTRRVIEVETVTYEMLDNNVGYIAIDQFEEVTSKQFNDAFDSLKADGMEALVIDLRNNPGGLLNVVVEMLDSILPEGVIVSVKDKYGQTDEYKSDKDTKLDVALAVLVNENSASASEIFAGAVKDYGVGTLVGNTTYGKGIVQTIFSLGDGTGMKVTIEDYYTPSGVSIHKTGIAPDVEVDLPDELKVLVQIPHDQDTQLIKALEVLGK